MNNILRLIELKVICHIRITNKFLEGIYRLKAVDMMMCDIMGETAGTQENNDGSYTNCPA